MVWSLGLRGLQDYAYPNCLPDDAGPQGCGAIISAAVANQTRILTEVTGKKTDELDFKFNLWTEALRLYEKGLLKLPPQTRLVMSDSGAGFIHGNPETFAAADGVYYHVKMLNVGGGQITEFVPPSRIFEQMSKFIRSSYRASTTHPLTNLLTHPPTYTPPTFPSIHPPTHPPIHPSIHPCIHPSSSRQVVQWTCCGLARFSNRLVYVLVSTGGEGCC